MNQNAQSPQKRKLVTIVLYIFATVMLCYSVYTYLIPHKVLVEDVEYMRETGLAIEMESEVSILGFTFSFIFWSVLPFLIGRKYSAAK
jgi:hypothetical protein